MAVMRNLMSKLKLTVNEKKTRRCRLPEETFDFLGYTIGRCYSPKTGEAYLSPKPSRKKVSRICDAISEPHRGEHTTLLSVEKMVAHLNRQLVGWANYFCLGPVSPAYRAIDQHVRRRLRQWLCAEAQNCRVRVAGTLPGQIPVPNFASCKAGEKSRALKTVSRAEGLTCLVREPDAGNPPVRFDEREVETEHGGIIWHRQPKGPATRMAHLNRRATSRLYSPGTAVRGGQVLRESPNRLNAMVQRICTVPVQSFLHPWLLFYYS